MFFAKQNETVYLTIGGSVLILADAVSGFAVPFFSVKNNIIQEGYQATVPAVSEAGEGISVHATVATQSSAVLVVAANAVVRFAHLVLSVVTDKGAKIRFAISKFRRFRNRIPTRKIFAKTLFLRL